MRILRLDFGQRQSTIDLHPFVTVVRELPEPEVVELLETVRGLARGSAAGIRGLVQHQGLLVELDGFGNDRLLSVTGANVVIDTDAAGSAGLPALQAQIDQLQRRAEIDAVIVEEIRADLAPSARARVADLQARLVPADEAEIARREEQSRRVSDALAAVAGHDPVITEAPPEVIELTRRLDAHQKACADAEQHFATLMNAIKHAETRAAKAERAFELAEAEAVPPLLTRAEEARLELLCFPDHDDTRKGKWRNKLKPEEEAERDALFERVGLDSWTAYTVYRASPTTSPERVEAAERAEQNLQAAQAGLEEARARLAADRITAELNDEQDAIRAAARLYLGQLLPSDLSRALRELVVQKPNPEWRSAIEQLKAVLASLDVALGDEPTPEASGGPVPPPLGSEVIEAAEKWLDRQRRSAIDIEHQNLEAELRLARHELDRHERALVRIDRAETAAAGSAARLEQLELQMTRRVEGGPVSLDAILNMIGPVAAQVELEARGSVPLAILGRFEELHDHEIGDLLDMLRTLSERLQIIVVSDHPAVTAWAGTVGMEHALVTKPKTISS